MNALSIRHRTTYRYREPVRLGPHRLMLRPRESHDLRLLSSTLELTPAASVSWTNDVFGNAVATVSFSGPADGLTIESLKGDLKRSAAYCQIGNLQQTYVS